MSETPNLFKYFWARVPYPKVLFFAQIQHFSALFFAQIQSLSALFFAFFLPFFLPLHRLLLEMRACQSITPFSFCRKNSQFVKQKLPVCKAKNWQFLMQKLNRVASWCMLSCMKTGCHRRPLGLSPTFLQIISDVLLDYLRRSWRWSAAPSETISHVLATMVALAIDNRTISNNFVRLMSPTMVAIAKQTSRSQRVCQNTESGFLVGRSVLIQPPITCESRDIFVLSVLIPELWWS